MRALACDIPHEAARETLISYFEQLRGRFLSWKNKHRAKRGNIPADERLSGFLLAFFRVQGILYTRVGIDELDELFESQFVYFGECLAQIEAEQAVGEERGVQIQKLHSIAFVLVFVAHATISDASKKLQADGEQDEATLLQSVFKQNLPSLALKQIAETMLILLDKIFKYPSEWLLIVSPLVHWLALHTEDHLAATLFSLCPTLPQELTRLHELLRTYSQAQSKMLSSDEQVDLLANLIPHTILPEETNMLGFMPLKSYLATKSVRKAEKTPADKEDLARAHSLLTDLEKLGCTMEAYEHTQKLAKVEEERKAADDDDLFGELDKQADTALPATLAKQSRPLIILDVQNIAMKHGRNQLFSTKGITVAVDYWRTNEHKVIGFLPDYLLDYEKVNQMKAERQYGAKIKEQKCPDDVSVLCNLESEGVLVRTPAQDYDDSYCIDYARRFDAFIVTNDRFRDYLEGQKAKSGGDSENADMTGYRAEEKWLKSHLVSYTFRADEFLPNPDSKLW